MRRPLMNGDIRQMQAMRAAGARNGEIRAATGRSLTTIAKYLGPKPQASVHPLTSMRQRAERIERLFQTCNRAISEVRV